ncbi:hypothetical protein GGQ86_000280 [Xanthobacter flavus]|uniref:DUF3253 domain-containing protein n=1 Tax=Xanthobacter flavus TaxID=281 RepID=A0A9W6CR57_XANFL|nr:DUF3253 domain-containing protein [Xanthobacter flavus]MDR6331833.1 hypothetical protein [Xanthobacter flavus]GLI22373.1 hypothetical protein XFLAVUS301_20470 [Xanthobacter flavus]
MTTSRTSDSTTSPSPLPDEEVAVALVLRLAGEVGPGKTIGPMDAALALMPKDEWQRALPVVRRVAVRLALEGRLMIYRKGKPVDPADFRGVYRIGLPRDE